MKFSAPPTIGQFVTVRGLLCVIVAIHPFGTIDVESTTTDHAFRLSGLSF